jgi:hypothetical protein
MLVTLNPLYLIYRSKNKQSPGDTYTLRGYLIDKEYFSNNPFAINILPAQPLCKPLNTSTLPPKYPREGGGGTQANRTT